MQYMSENLSQDFWTDWALSLYQFGFPPLKKTNFPWKVFVQWSKWAAEYRNGFFYFYIKLTHICPHSTCIISIKAEMHITYSSNDWSDWIIVKFSNTNAALL